NCIVIFGKLIVAGEKTLFSHQPLFCTTVFSTPHRIKAKGFIQVIIGNRDPIRWDVLCDQKAAAVPLVDSPL
ncbi:hypothetical protein, partial [Limosilactobacillus pontis]|uniref:hypothetical protein n=1 Tax=Limosilactobacillus pontis TaxID=35787 RepID=UPI00241EAA3B